MSNMLNPRRRQWYAHLDKGGTFQVVAIDHDAGLIEVQNCDGDVEEFEREFWRESPLEAIDAPEDWSGPFDETGTDDGAAAEPDAAARDWRIAIEDVHDSSRSIRRARWIESCYALATTCKT